MFVHNITARSVNEALPQGLRILANHCGLTEQSRNGPVRVMPGPVSTLYQFPQRRVLFSPMRDANPFFHFFESLWMLAGRDDLPIIVQFNKRFNTYSDDGGKTQPAAYGHRWRNYFGHDQLDDVVAELSRDHGTRRAVLAMWDAGGDYAGGKGDLSRALAGSADIPCNTHCYFRIRDKVVDMAVMCRSNDILWGAYGANAVHFSVLQEYIAARLGLTIGVMYQYSFNYHYYMDIVGDQPRAMELAKDCEAHDLYQTERIKPMPMFADVVGFMADLPHMMNIMDPAIDDLELHGRAGALTNPFLRNVAVPMWWTWQAHKRKDYAEAETHVGKIQADDWRVACRMWIQRRALKHRDKLAAEAAAQPATEGTDNGL